MENRAVEIRAEDLVRRPGGGAVKAAAGAKTWNPVELIKQFKEGMKLVQELAAQAQSMGININLPGLKNLENKVAKTTAAQEPQADQYRAFINLLIVRYGDITLNEVFGKLRQDMGNKKLSQIGR